MTATITGLEMSRAATITAMKHEYVNFLMRKMVLAEREGFTVDPARLNAINFPHQNAAIRWLAAGGRRVCAASFGLGKTGLQCELHRLAHEDSGLRTLQVCPLGVRHQFITEDGPKWGLHFQYVRTDAELDAADTPYVLTNYERIREGDIDPRKHRLALASFDEGDVFRSLGSETYDVFRDVFQQVPFRFIFTATPSPNEYRELINYADMLGIMDRGAALTRFFKRDTSKAGNLQLHPLQEDAFWLWVSSWMLCYYRPSDLGFSDEGYELPDLNVLWHRLPVDHTRAFGQTESDGQARLLLNAANGVTEASQEKKATLPARLAKAQEILATDPDGHWLLWHHQEEERHAIQQALPEATTIYGAQDLEVRDQAIVDFAHGKLKLLAPKPQIAGAGCNLQHFCHQNIFLGVDYKFRDFIQAIHRTYRFQQQHPVDVHIIYSESEDTIAAALRRKWTQHEKLVENMRKIVQRYGLAVDALHEELHRKLGVNRKEVRGQRYHLIYNDCLLETLDMADNTVGLTCTSIPFGNHYEYTDQYEDFGHNITDHLFWEQMDFLVPELYRVTMPGRLAAIHIKDRIKYKHQTDHGMPEIDPTSDDCVRSFRKHGWLYEGRRVIITDVVRENNSTYRLGYGEMMKDASKMGSGLPEYVLLFRKPNTDRKTARADIPVRKREEEYHLARWQIDAHDFWRSDGNRLLHPQELYNFQAHVDRLHALEAVDNLPKTFMYEAPKSWHPHVWDDINPMRCLNLLQTMKGRENHLCPLPFDIVNRLITLYSNPGDVVFDPFGGLMTTPYLAIEQGRYGLACELNAAYFTAGAGYCADMEQKVTAPTLFDLMETEEAR